MYPIYGKNIEKWTDDQVDRALRWGIFWIFYLVNIFLLLIMYIIRYQYFWSLDQWSSFQQKNALRANTWILC